MSDLPFGRVITITIQDQGPPSEPLDIRNVLRQYLTQLDKDNGIDKYGALFFSDKFNAMFSVEATWITHKMPR